MQMQYAVHNIKSNFVIVHSRPQKAIDFDFSDDVAPTQMRVRSQTSTPKSAKKKTANFAGVLETLKKKKTEGS